RLKRRGAVVVRRDILRLGCDGVVKMVDGRTMLALGRGNHAEIMGDGGMARSNVKSVSVGRLGLIETSGLVMRYRFSDQLIEFARHIGMGVRRLRRPRMRRR